MFATEVDLLSQRLSQKYLSLHKLPENKQPWEKDCIDSSQQGKDTFSSHKAAENPYWKSCYPCSNYKKSFHSILHAARYWRIWLQDIKPQECKMLLLLLTKLRDKMKVIKLWNNIRVEENHHLNILLFPIRSGHISLCMSYESFSPGQSHRITES